MKYQTAAAEAGLCFDTDGTTEVVPFPAYFLSLLRSLSTKFIATLTHAGFPKPNEIIILRNGKGTSSLVPQ
jgi:hypothetical protein